MMATKEEFRNWMDELGIKMKETCSHFFLNIKQKFMLQRPKGGPKCKCVRCINKCVYYAKEFKEWQQTL